AGATSQGTTAADWFSFSARRCTMPGVGTFACRSRRWRPSRWRHRVGGRLRPDLSRSGDVCASNQRICMTTARTVTSPSSSITFKRRLPVGAELIDGHTVDFRVWAPRVTSVEVVLPERQRTIALTPEGNGYHRGTFEAKALDLYQLRLDGQERLLPDPASRFQPQGPHGPSQVID